MPDVTCTAPSICVKFLHPVSRFKEYPVRSLQQLAKHVILEHVRKDYIDKLVLPNRLKAYLKEHQVFDWNGRLERTSHDNQSFKIVYFSVKFFIYILLYNDCAIYFFITNFQFVKLYRKFYFFCKPIFTHVLT